MDEKTPVFTDELKAQAEELLRIEQFLASALIRAQVARDDAVKAQPAKGAEYLRVHRVSVEKIEGALDYFRRRVMANPVIATHINVVRSMAVAVAVAVADAEVSLVEPELEEAS